MPTLYIVATPIGNLEDISLRALRILSEVDLILAEDTRVTSRLLDHYKIKARLVSYHQHSRLAKVEQIVAELCTGKNLALVTDGGTPGISDPGGRLVARCLAELGDELKVVAVPGASAVAAAASVSGLPTDKFLFLGFPPHKKGRAKFFTRVMESAETVIFYESCHRILPALNALEESLLADRRIMVCRELTKKFETIYRGTVSEVLNALREDKIKGEFVVVVEGK